LSKNEIQSDSASKKTHNSFGSDSKNPDPEQHWYLPAEMKVELDINLVDLQFFDRFGTDLDFIIFD